LQKTENEFENMIEKNCVIVFRGKPEHKQKVEDFLDSIGATVIFVKQTDVNRKLVVKNLPKWGDENDSNNLETD
jgi:hypothetical protein